MISIITCTIRDDFFENIVHNFIQQLVTQKELIIILNKNSLSLEKWKQQVENLPFVSVYQLPEEYSLGECLNFGIVKAKYDFIAKFDDDDYYGPYFLEEALNVIRDTNCSIIGKASFYTYFKTSKALAIFNSSKENKTINGERDFLSGATLVFKKAIFTNVQFPKLNVGEDTVFQRNCLKKGLRLYSTSLRNFVHFRYNSRTHHTSDVKNERFIKKCKIIIYTNDFRPYID